MHPSLQINLKTLKEVKIVVSCCMKSGLNQRLVPLQCLVTPYPHSGGDAGVKARNWFGRISGISRPYGLGEVGNHYRDLILVLYTYVIMNLTMRNRLLQYKHDILKSHTDLRHHHCVASSYPMVARFDDALLTVSSPELLSVLSHGFGFFHHWDIDPFFDIMESYLPLNLGLFMSPSIPSSQHMSSIFDFSFSYDIEPFKVRFSYAPEDFQLGWWFCQMRWDLEHPFVAPIFKGCDSATSFFLQSPWLTTILC